MQSNIFNAKHLAQLKGIHTNSSYRVIHTIKKHLKINRPGAYLFLGEALKYFQLTREELAEMVPDFK